MGLGSGGRQLWYRRTAHALCHVIIVSSADQVAVQITPGRRCCSLKGALLDSRSPSLLSQFVSGFQQVNCAAV